MLGLLPFPNIDPTIFTLDLGPVAFSLRWYAVAYIAGLLIAWRWIASMMRTPSLWRHNAPPMTEKQPEDLLTWIILGVILGGRLGFVLFYQPRYYLAHPDEIIAVWQGGMSFHGGFLGVIVAAMWFCRRHSLAALSVGDAMAVSVTVGLFLGRAANFINSELWGRPTDAPWGVVFPDQRASVCPDGWIGECARHPSQLYEAGMEGLLLGALMIWLIYRRGWLRTPGAIIGVFAAGYGASRFIVEFFRQADPQFVSASNPFGHVVRFGADVGALGLTMGQLLSLPMILVGLGFLIATRRRV